MQLLSILFEPLIYGDLEHLVGITLTDESRASMGSLVKITTTRKTIVSYTLNLLDLTSTKDTFTKPTRSHKENIDEFQTLANVSHYNLDDEIHIINAVKNVLDTTVLNTFSVFPC